MSLKLDLFTGKQRDILIEEYEKKLEEQREGYEAEIRKLQEMQDYISANSDCKSVLIDGLCRAAAGNGNSELRRLAERVMFFAALQFEDNEVADGSFNVLEFMDTLVGERRAEADARGITLRGQIKSIRDTKVVLKRDGLMEVLRIMISEALRCTRAGDSVMLNCEQIEPKENEELAFCFTVRDSGAERMEGDFAGYFEPFGKERGGISTPDRVELAILVKLCELIDADLEANNGEDSGMMFRITVGAKRA